MRTKLSGSIIEHWKTWPEFHKQTDGVTVNYEKPFLVLLHDELAYEQLFGQDFNHTSTEEDAHKLQS
jgi:hypothetical protein